MNKQHNPLNYRDNDVNEANSVVFTLECGHVASGRTHVWLHDTDVPFILCVHNVISPLMICAIVPLFRSKFSNMVQTTFEPRHHGKEGEIYLHRYSAVVQSIILESEKVLLQGSHAVVTLLAPPGLLHPG